LRHTSLAFLLALSALWALPGVGAAEPAAATADGAPDPELAALSIGIAPFEHVAPPGEPVPDLAQELAARILLRGTGRTVAPASLPDARQAEPSSERVRALAGQHGLDALVVGRVTRLGDRVSIDVRLRDGSSGAVAGTYVAELPLADPADPVLDRLASQLITGALSLSHGSLLPPEAPPAGVAAAAPGAPTPETQGGAEREARPRAQAAPARKGRAGGAGLSLDSLGDGDQPFSIHSDELEVSEGEGGGRQLSFRGNVEARRGDLVLSAGRLEATYPEGGKRPSALSARGSVRVRQGEREARCSRADYRESDQRIVCRGDAVLRDGGDELRGDAIVFDLERRSIHVEGGSEVALTPGSGSRSRSDGAKRGRSGPLGDLPTEGPVRIRAAQLEAVEQDDGGRRIRFDGSVEVVQEDLVLRAREIEAIYPPGAREPERLVARGDVVVEQRGREARCDEAVYLRQERRVDCTGNASLREGEDQVSGREIAFDLAAEKLVVTGETRLVLAPRSREETATP
jgi:lipopolysaccharide transport protein LptA